ncbi:ATP synthase F1 subunit epsilon [Floccifex sp.]|uniref:ATP synthase F1 subunit epsilon n=1 Tax=Floccifex sp. TaxID=2815810 RepID=UPI002A764E10|nr:ATP synthase F1 subunit epsilon [Floccifex sp.]MDY2958227.1 ATP synthase F1 subunit epsilon [Floccifex sp.]
MTFTLHIVASDRIFYQGECESLVIPTDDGLIGVMANHSNMIMAIVPGELQFQVPGKEREICAIGSGMLKVENNDVLVLLDSVERPDEIDEKRAQQAVARAKEEMLQKKSIQEYHEAQAHLARALSRLKVKSH